MRNLFKIFNKKTKLNVYLIDGEHKQNINGIIEFINDWGCPYSTALVNQIKSLNIGEKIINPGVFHSVERVS